MGGQGREKGSINKVPRKPSLKVGEVHGVWTILEFQGAKHRYPGDGRKDQFWLCQCGDCGRIESRTTALLRGSPHSCRCHLIVSDASFHRAFRTYKRQAKVRSLPFELSLDDFKEIVISSCSYCGQPPGLNSYSSDSKVRVPMNGIDRKDSDLGYTSENCIPCCGTCNLAKLDYPEDFFLKWAARLAEFQKDKLMRSINTNPGVCTENTPRPEEELEGDDSE